MGPRRNVFDGLGGILNAEYRHAAGGSDPPPPPRPPTRHIPVDAPPLTWTRISSFGTRSKGGRPRMYRCWTHISLTVGGKFFKLISYILLLNYLN